MPLEPPNLDDRTYQDIVTEVKQRIPRYTPEMTDHNESNPAITLIEHLAWMTELLLWRLNQVPELNYIKFLQMLGVERKPAQPARTELTFALTTNAVDAVIIPLGTQVAVEDSDEPLLFEIDTALIALGATLDAVQSYDGFQYTLETNKNAVPGQTFTPFGNLAREGSALLLGFDTPLDFTAQQINLAVQVDTTGREKSLVPCEVDVNRIPPPAEFLWEYWDSRAWSPLTLERDDTRAFSQSGHVYLRGPGSKAKRTQIGRFSDPRYWIRARLTRSGYEQAPVLRSVLTNTVRATQAITIRDEVLGGSDGRPDQSFQLANFPIVPLEKPEIARNPDGTVVEVTSLRLEIDEGDGQGFQVWQEVSDFFASKPTDRHYTLNRTTGAAKCGDGTNGRIPVANLTRPNNNIVARMYRTGGGTFGNVGAGTITGLQTAINFVDTVTNLQAAEGGQDEEGLAQTKLRAANEIKSKDRAVTAEDFETLAKNFVARAKALPLTHPEFLDVPIPGAITVIVVPQSDAPNPLPNETTLRTVCACLNERRLLTSEVYVIGPTYRRIRVEANVIARPEADLATVLHDMEARLETFFHPLRGGRNGTGWEFGGTIYNSEVYRVLLETEGVDRIENNQLDLWLDEERQEFCRDVPINPTELLYSAGHTIRVLYDLGA